MSIVSSINRTKGILLFRGGAAAGSAKLMKDIIDEDSENNDDDNDSNIRSVVDQIETVLNHGTHPHFHLHHYDHNQDQTMRLENNILKMLHAKSKSNRDNRDEEAKQIKAENDNFIEMPDISEGVKIEDHGKVPYTALKEKESAQNKSEKTKASHHHSKYQKLQVPPYVSCTRFLLVNRCCLFYIAITTGIRNRAKLMLKKEEDQLKVQARKRL
ncbi:MAG TPA: hypothetical protein VHA52_10960 [Candidatus Babeliaceae bacterium]|nr:hypothetical protein [Candidatus Babeliaceae bacterium]